MTSLLKFLRKARIIVALVVFVLITAQFLDLYNQLPKPYYMYNPIKTQFAPSLIKWISTGAIVSAGAFVTFSICALLFGRVYCASFCAFGILMDIIRFPIKKIAKLKFFKNSRLGKFLKDVTTMKYRNAKNCIRIFFLSLATILIFCGWSTMLGLFEPYSLYGKIMGSVVHPVAALLTDATSAKLYEFEIYTIGPINGNPRISIVLFGFALLILISITIATILRGRIFCNTVCPVGAYLGVLSKFSLFTLVLDSSKCVSCGMCERHCKSECVDAKNKKLDFSKCVLCLNCVNSCPKNALTFEVNRFYKKNQKVEEDVPNKEKKSKQSANISRRTFPIAVSSLVAAMMCGAKKDSQIKKSDNTNVSPYGVKGDRPDKRLTAPPGAISVENFLENCTACQICTAVCKAQILKPSISEWGLSHFMQPYMDFNEGFCLYDCHNCSKACPTGAIKFISGKEKRKTKIGTAIFDEDLCIVKTDGTDCAACGEHCPVQAIEMIPFGDEKKSLYIPYVHPDVCIGCGACESICPVRPHRAIVVEGLAVHKPAKKFEESMRKHKTIQTKPTEKLEKTDNPFPF